MCAGKRYNYETLQVKYKGHSIADLLELTVEEALPLLEANPQIKPKLQTLLDVGLGYIHLASLRLRSRVAKPAHQAREGAEQAPDRAHLLRARRTYYGLHFEDVRKLLEVLQKLVELGNTVLVIEHNWM